MRFDFTQAEYEWFVQRAGFTDDELSVLHLKRRGWYNLQVADELNISERTVKRRVCAIKAKIMKTLLCPF